jgi:hypothetical protein
MLVIPPFTALLNHRRRRSFPSERLSLRTSDGHEVSSVCGIVSVTRSGHCMASMLCWYRSILSREMIRAHDGHHLLRHCFTTAIPFAQPQHTSSKGSPHSLSGAARSDLPSLSSRAITPSRQWERSITTQSVQQKGEGVNPPPHT